MANSSNKIVVPNAREAMDRFKMEAAGEVGVSLKHRASPPQPAAQPP